MWKKLFQRLNSIFKAKANDALDQIEDPVQMVKLAIEELSLSVRKATEALSKAIANEKELVHKCEQHKLSAEAWMAKAEYALKSGNEELAKQALVKKSLDEKQYEQYALMADSARKNVETLKDQLNRMNLKLDEAKSKQNILLAKAQNAKAQKEIATQLGGIDNSAFSNFQKYEDKINKMDFEATALTELVDSTTKVEREFDKLESETKVSSDLDKLKAKLEQDKIKNELEANQKSKSLFNDKFKDATDATIVEDKAISSGNENKLPVVEDNEQIKKKIDDFFNKKS
ncbi:MAG: PspA/IM30 family protein [Cytophagaceae bacterium]|jgi:phage shock protein A|nr:PspA/IM30 family protein [Cytophagaceae bacterium]